jgi:hypothetical protein
MRRSTPGSGWVLVVVAVLAQSLALLPLIVQETSPCRFRASACRCMSSWRCGASA